MRTERRSDAGEKDIGQGVPWHSLLDKINILFKLKRQIIIQGPPMLKIAFSAPTLPKSGAAVLTVAADRTLGKQGVQIDRKLGGVIKHAMADSHFTGAREQTLTIMAPAKTKLTRL